MLHVVFPDQLAIAVDPEGSGTAGVDLGNDASVVNL